MLGIDECQYKRLSEFKLENNKCFRCGKLDFEKRKKIFQCNEVFMYI